MKPGIRLFIALGAAALILGAAACEEDRTNPQVADASPSASRDGPGPRRSPEKQKKNDEKRSRKRER
ncbi:MAG TPA: hypothetical protein VEV82_04035, partial [Actinomycetota bacterium]|nr:hypothetical protein [Actinomycetota bacterium]